MEEKDQILKAQNPYQVLLLSTTATPEEAKYQYFKLVKKYSPVERAAVVRSGRFPSSLRNPTPAFNSGIPPLARV